MARKEERKTAARLYSPNNAHQTADTFEYGAEWADKTMIRKACEWLKDNASNYIIENLYSSIVNFKEDEMIEDFKQAMED